MWDKNTCGIEKTEAKKEPAAPGTQPPAEEVKAKPAKEEKLSFDRKLDNSIFRKLGSWKEGEYKQTYLAFIHDLI